MKLTKAVKMTKLQNDEETSSFELTPQIARRN